LILAGVLFKAASQLKNNLMAYILFISWGFWGEIDISLVWRGFQPKCVWGIRGALLGQMGRFL
jgi:hypothetical protein